MFILINEIKERKKEKQLREREREQKKQGEEVLEYDSDD